MRRGAIARWIEAARSVGLALLDVLAAEMAELKRDVSRSGRELRRGLLLLAAAGFIAFWTLGLGLAAAAVLLSTWWSLLAALSVLSGCGLLLTLVLIWLGKSRLGRIETPVQAFKRRSRDHAEWWQNEVVPGLMTGGDGEGPARDREARSGAAEATPDGPADR